MNEELTNTEAYDIIIVGAGISGSSAAYFLKKKLKDLKILIIEAKDRVGGRTQTVELNGSIEGKKVKLDAGGQWVTNTQENITKLLSELNIETYRQFDSGKKVLEHDKFQGVYSSSIPNISIPSLIELQLKLNKINSNAQKLNTLNPFKRLKLANSLDETNLEQFLFSNSFSSATRGVINVAIRTIYGLEPNQINTLFGLFYINSGKSTIESLALTDEGCAQEKRVKGGTQQISRKLIECVLENSNTKESFSQLLLNTALKEIIQNENELVQVVTENTTNGKNRIFKAKKVISSIPINQYIHVGFKPELPFFKRNVFKFMQMGNYIKFIVTYKTAFWRTKGYSGEVVSDGSVIHCVENDFKVKVKEELVLTKPIPTIGPILCMYDATTNENEPALIGFIGGKTAVEWLDQTPELRKKEILGSIARFFGNEALENIDFFEKVWSEEKFSGGCPTVNVSSSGIMKDYVRATREPYLNVHFCGTESAIEWQGYMDGAVESGERAANEVLFTMFNDKSKIDYKKTYYYQKEELKSSVGENQFEIFAKFFLKVSFILVLIFAVLFKLNFLS